MSTRATIKLWRWLHVYLELTPRMTGEPSYRAELFHLDFGIPTRFGHWLDLREGRKL